MYRDIDNENPTPKVVESESGLREIRLFIHIQPILGRGCVGFVLRYTYLTRSGSVTHGIRLFLTSKRSHVYRETMKNPTPKVVESESGLRGIRLFYIYLTRSGSAIPEIRLFLTSKRSHVYRDRDNENPTPKVVELF